MENNFLGKGWSFPPQFYADGAEVELVSGEEDIKQSLEIILSTSLKERVMMSDFGCDLSQFLFEEVDQSLINEMRGVVSDAILKYEPRVKAEQVAINNSAEEGMLAISIDYVVRTTNNRYNLVYPFYLKEASV
ncbi:GPW/gp25 family protein [Fulvivirga maritima]|uniref:GPW/gp25 family protein n=1 Tax=Fulvivirga maritima TaxID=2904247 RepID=UPI001F2414A5|nr:GPW/gp25 family protein [Fulvivirga maritima]UII24678.1 GPW/gp25 family protein [Fulvivirga maritima]